MRMILFECTQFAVGVSAGLVLSWKSLDQRCLWGSRLCEADGLHEKPRFVLGKKGFSLSSRVRLKIVNRLHSAGSDRVFDFPVCALNGSSRSSLVNCYTYGRLNWLKVIDVKSRAPMVCEPQVEERKPDVVNCPESKVSPGLWSLSFEADTDMWTDMGSRCPCVGVHLRSLCSWALALSFSLCQTLGTDAVTALPPNYACQDVSRYYESVQGLKGGVLKVKLHDLIRDHRVFSYIQAWDAIKILDAADGSGNSVIDIYSLRIMANELAGKSDGWNREHLWPRSYGLVQGQPEYTDLHNLRPVDANVNSARGNKYFGECPIDLKSDCLIPANKEAASDTGTDRFIWMPPAQVRGDIARAVLYMAVRYGNDQPPGSHDLKLSDSPSVGHSEMGLLSVLLHWNMVDPPSSNEEIRNASVCSLFQHNRNPFVDHPEFAELIWGPARSLEIHPPMDSVNLNVELSGKRNKSDINILPATPDAL